jgi:hypothetical protein
MDSPQVSGTRRSAEGDADQAFSFAIGLEDATPQRVAAVAAVILKTWHADVDRLTAAATVCRRRHSEGREDGWGEAAGLLDQAVRMVYEAGADTDDACNRCCRSQVARHRRGSDDGPHPGGRDDSGHETRSSILAERKPHSSLGVSSLSWQRHRCV